MYHVYVIENENGSWYIGYSTNLRQRLAAHNLGKNISTAKSKNWKLIYCETYVQKMDALGREKFLKSGSGWKLLKKQMKHYLEQKQGLLMASPAESTSGYKPAPSPVSLPVGRSCSKD